jgi:hypothetical protein
MWAVAMSQLMCWPWANFVRAARKSSQVRRPAAWCGVRFAPARNARAACQEAGWANRTTPGDQAPPCTGEWSSWGGDHRTRPALCRHGFTVAHGKIVEIDSIADPERVGRIAAAVLREE